MSSDFKGWNVIVMGGSKGIGRAVARDFMRHGARLAVCGRTAAPLASLQQELREGGNDIYTGQCDVGDAAAVAAFIPAAAAALQGIDVLVNCASAFAVQDDDEGWASSLGVDVMGSVRASRAATPFLRQSPHASIINIGSIAALNACDNRAPYGAAKAAIVHYTASHAKMLAPARIRVNCVLPGSTDFDGGPWDRIRKARPEFYEKTRDSIPMGRFAQPEDIARVVLFLASAEAGWITGQSIVADGGQTLTD